VEKIWPHAPVHQLGTFGVYMVTGGTLYKDHVFRGAERLTLLEAHLLRIASEHHWQLEAWSVFPNHYHFIARGEPDCCDLGKFVKHLHADTARVVNRLDGKLGRNVWFNFWDSRLTYHRGYLARLNYVHQNPVRHGIVPLANQYEWCSAAWLERTASRATVETIYGMKTDQLSVRDDFDVPAIEFL